MLLLSSVGFSCGSAGKESTCNAGDLGLIPGFGRSPGEGKGYPLQYSGLENPMDCVVHGVANSWAKIRDFHFTEFSESNCHCLAHSKSFLKCASKPGSPSRGHRKRAGSSALQEDWPLGRITSPFLGSFSNQDQTEKHHPSTTTIALSSEHF